MRTFGKLLFARFSALQPSEATHVNSSLAPNCYYLAAQISAWRDYSSRALSMTPNAVQKRNKRLKAAEARTVALHIAKQTGHSPKVLFHLIAAMRADHGDKLEVALAAVMSHMGLGADALPQYLPSVP